MGLALCKTTLLPRLFAPLALVLGPVFQSLGLVAVFNAMAVSLVIVILVLQRVWTMAVLAYLSQQARDRLPALPATREQNGREVLK